MYNKHTEMLLREKRNIFSFHHLLIKSGLPSLGISISHDSDFYSVYFRRSLVSNMWGLSCLIVSAWHFLAHLYFHPSLFTVIVLTNCICWQFMMKWGKKFLQTVEWPTQSFEDKDWDMDSSFSYKMWLSKVSGRDGWGILGDLLCLPVLGSHPK